MSKWRMQTHQEIEAEMQLNKKQERLGDKAYDLMLIWKQRIEDDVDDHLKNEDPISEVYVGQLIYALRRECDKYAFNFDELCKKVQ